MKKNLLLTGVACLFAISSANAADFQLKPYIGIDLGYTDGDIKIDGVDKNLYETDFATMSFNVGANLNQYFGLEAFYQVFSEGETDVYIGAQRIEKTKTNLEAYGLDALGYMPLNDKLDAIGSLGIGQYDFEVKGRYGRVSEDGLGYRLGLGAQYNINDKIAVRAMAHYVILDMDYADSLTEFSVGARYTF